jgi:hypothetical protein
MVGYGGKVSSGLSRVCQSIETQRVMVRATYSPPLYSGQLAEMEFFILFYLCWFPKDLGLLLDGKKTLFPPFMAVEKFKTHIALGDCP